jgi:hypothetical protein
MNARSPEPPPRPTNTRWPAARPPALAAVPRRPRDAAEAPRPDADHGPADLDEPGYGHGV